MTGLILKHAPIGWNQDDFDVIEDGVIVGRIFMSPSAPQDWQWMGERPQRRDPQRGARADARGCDGGVPQILAARMTLATRRAAPQGRPWKWASGHNGDIKRAAHGYEPTREARWRRSRRAGGVRASARCSAWFGRAGYSKHWDRTRLRRCVARGTNPSAICLMTR
jgi:hypothetical protein